MTKQEKLKDVYGDVYDKFKVFISEYDGSIPATLLGELKLDFEILDKDFIRPKSLSGFESNNDWVKIKSIDDLPKENGIYWTFINGKISLDTLSDDFDREVWEDSFLSNSLLYYQPIEKPKPPLY